MNPNPSSGSASRRAALLLHAMAPSDRDWLLGSLPPMRRQRLAALLRELQALGIPADPPLLQALTERASAVAPAGSMQRLQLLSSDEVAWLAVRLQEEPPELAAMLLAQCAWPWRAALLQRLDPVRQQCVEQGGTARSLQLPAAALCEALVKMLPGVSPTPPSSATRRVWARLGLSPRGTACR